ncbi:hypothetical protein [Paenibacillus illinoisensis]|uniref:DUF7167 family protein n=1 Tax=Paenibacillus illinoisensis TaxID=59845 RepID=UPI0013E3C37D|nr:hypothetical protein [Paenibacillus illinoisensis]
MIIVVNVDWKMTIGFPGAEREGTVEIDPVELEGKSEAEQDEIIYKEIWDDAMQYVDVFPTRRYEGDET